MKKTLSLVASFVLAYAAGYIGSYATVPAIDSWYAGLLRSSLTPPDWVFGPVWALLYALMALAAWRVFLKRSVPGARKALVWYALSLVLNALWSIVFFGLHAPGVAFAVILLLLCVIVFVALRFWRIERLAGLLFLPYILWVAFALYLNLAIVLLN